MKEELKFAKWCLKHIKYLSDCTYQYGSFELESINKYFDTVDEIYKYWLENVKIDDTK